MADELFTAVDTYVDGLFRSDDATLTGAHCRTATDPPVIEPRRSFGRPPETPGFLCVCQAASGSFCRAWIFRRSSAVMIRQARSARRRRFKRSIG